MQVNYLHVDYEQGDRGENKQFAKCVNEKVDQHEEEQRVQQRRVLWHYCGAPYRCSWLAVLVLLVVIIHSYGVFVFNLLSLSSLCDHTHVNLAYLFILILCYFSFFCQSFSLSRELTVASTIIEFVAMEIHLLCRTTTLKVQHAKLKKKIDHIEMFVYLYIV